MTRAAVASVFGGLALLSLTVSSASAGALAASLSRGRPGLPASPARRGRTIDLDAANNMTGGGYFAEIGIGSPPQKLRFLLDTGSSDTWVNSVDADLCQSEQRQMEDAIWCERQFDPRSSSTFKMVDKGGFDIKYLDQRSIAGDYFNDTVTVDGRPVARQQLGLALRSDSPTGIMGLGFRSGVAARSTYPTVIDNMVAQGVIDAPAFSLYLNDVEAQSGTILFGGIDSRKYYGKLATLPLLSDLQSRSSNITSYTVRLKGLQVDGIDVDNLDAAAVLDSGSTLSLLPDDLVQTIYRHFGVRSIQSVPTPLVDCNCHKGKKVTFDFQFDGAIIRVPIDHMVINAFPDNAQRTLRDSGLNELLGGWDRICMFGIGSARDYGISTDRFALLGDSFLRSAYVVYDMANQQLGLAQANANSGQSNIIEIKKNAKNLPDVDGVQPEASASAVSYRGPFSIGASVRTLVMAIIIVLTTL